MVFRIIQAPRFKNSPKIEFPQQFAAAESDIMSLWR